MTQTSIQGFPRIGKNRDLKFALESYWSKKSTVEDLQAVAKQCRLSNYQTFKQTELDYTPVGDFSYYDGMLDMMLLVGAIPPQHKSIGLTNQADLYFACARGYQDDTQKVDALALKKWFNTNYHYLVPELTANTSYDLNADLYLALVDEALEEGVSNPTPQLIGPCTFLALANKQNVDVAEHAAQLSAVYTQLLTTLKNKGIETVQIHEPILVCNPLPMDQSVVEAVYSQLASAGVTIFLQTYFDQLGDAYKWVVNLPVAGIGLDFIYGPQNLNLVQQHGFPADKTLLAGVVDGRNIWCLDVNQAEETLNALKASGVTEDRLIISTSCSLLHVPYSLTPENKLPHDVKQALSFAEEKCTELQALKNNDASLQELRERRQSFLDNPRRHSDAVQEAVTAAKAETRGRKAPFENRIDEQRRELNLPLFPTTTIGSFPQTPEVRQTRRQWRQGELSPEKYEEFVNEKMQELVKLQEEIGLDVLVHGEFERNDMVEFFGEKLTGYEFTANAWVQSYGSRCVKPPIIFGDISRPRAMTVKEIVYAQSLTTKAMKGMLTGPVTILNWSFVRNDMTREEVCRQIGLAIKDEVLDLEKAGIKVIQVDEAAFREGVPLRTENQQSYLDWAVECFQLSVDSVENKTQIHTHMCYSEFNEYMSSIAAMDADVISIECSRAADKLLEVFRDQGYPNEVGPGVYDIHSPNIPSVEEMIEKLRVISGILDIKKVWVNPDCGLKTRKNDEVIPSLRNMIKAAQKIREEVKTTVE